MICINTLRPHVPTELWKISNKISNSLKNIRFKLTSLTWFPFFFSFWWIFIPLLIELLLFPWHKQHMLIDVCFYQERHTGPQEQAAVQKQMFRSFLVKALCPIVLIPKQSNCNNLDAPSRSNSFYMHTFDLKWHRPVKHVSNLWRWTLSTQITCKKFYFTVSTLCTGSQCWIFFPHGKLIKNQSGNQ